MKRIASILFVAAIITLGLASCAGVFATYDEKGETYCTLKDAQYQ